MNVTIKIPDNFPKNKIQEAIEEIEKNLTYEVEATEQEKSKSNELSDDPWANPDIDLPSVDTGIEDLSINHDYYLYGIPKHI